MLHRLDSTTDAIAIHRTASLGGFATPLHLGNSHGNPPQANPFQARVQQQPPLTLTTSHTSPGSRPMVNESSFRLPKQGVSTSTPNIYDPRLAASFISSANINLSPTSTAGSSGAPPSMGRSTSTTTTTTLKNSSEMEDEPRDFAELPKTSPHFNAHLLLPLPGATRQYASDEAPGQEEQDALRTSKLSFAPILAPVEVVPYGADRVLFVEGLICQYALSLFRSFTLSLFSIFSLFSNFGNFLWQVFVVGGHTAFCHPIRVYRHTDSLRGFDNAEVSPGGPVPMSRRDSDHIGHD
jgi:hypothetical protein